MFKILKKIHLKQNDNNQRLTIPIVGLLLVFTAWSIFGMFPRNAYAGDITSAQDTMSRLKASTASTHTFSFTTATALTATQTIALEFDTTASNAFTLAGTIAAADFTSVSGFTVVDACTAAASEVQPTINNTTDIVTLTVCTSDTVAAGAKVFTIASTIATNPTAGDYMIGITTTSDTGKIGVSIIANDIVNITAVVDPIFTFSISDVTIGFASLTTGAARWATGDLAGSASATVAHTFAVATNATNGYAVTYNGATLTSTTDVGDSITVASITDDADGTPGSEQFGISVSTNGDATIASGYAYAGTPDYKWIASTTTTVASEIVPTATETFSVYYLANIATTTEPGSYSTNVTYIATATY